MPTCRTMHTWCIALLCVKSWSELLLHISPRLGKCASPSKTYLEWRSYPQFAKMVLPINGRKMYSATSLIQTQTGQRKVWCPYCNCLELFLKTVKASHTVRPIIGIGLSAMCYSESCLLRCSVDLEHSSYDGRSESHPAFSRTECNWYTLAFHWHPGIQSSSLAHTTGWPTQESDASEFYGWRAKYTGGRKEALINQRRHALWLGPRAWLSYRTGGP